MPQRTFSEEEVAALIQRAAELQAAADRRDDGEPRITLGELEAVAADAGIDPRMMRRAAAEIAHGVPAPQSGRRSATSTHITVDHRADAPLTDDAWAEVVAELRHRYDSDQGSIWGMPELGRGKTEEIGRTRVWRHTNLSGVETRVQFRARGEVTHIRLTQRVGYGAPGVQAGFIATPLAFLAAIVSGSIASSEAVGFSVLFAALVMLVPLIHYADRAWRAKKHDALDALGDELAELLADAALLDPPAPSAPPLLDDASGAGDLYDDERAPGASDAARAGRQRG